MSAMPVICIVGPTASGKSSLADRVALALGTSVVSVDAMQVYRGMDVGTAKTPPSERRVPLLMVDVADVGTDFSAKLFQHDARRCVDDLLARGLPAVLCGGTGLYLNAVIDEMEFPPGDSDNPRRARYQSYAESNGSLALYALLCKRDAASAALIHPHNVRRVVRALELCDEGGSYAVRHAGLHERMPHYPALLFGIRMDRPRLYRRIGRRVDAMFEAGLVEEVQGLLGRGLGEALTARQAIGYKEVMDYLAGACTLDAAKERAKMRTRRYAKRQLSWFEHDGRVRWLDYDELDEDAALQVVLSSVAPTVSPGGLALGGGEGRGHA